MATLQELCVSGDLVRIDVPLDADQNVERLIFAFPKFTEWVQNVLPDIQTSILGLEEHPDQQLDAFLNDFISGEALSRRQRFRRLSPADRGIWELKTADIRIFGWFVRRDVFVATAADEKKRLRDINGLYGGYRDEAVRMRDSLDLDPPKYVEGGDYDDVVSN